MTQVVDLNRMRELIERGAQLVEVLPAEEYAEQHIPGAVSHPLKELDAARAEQLDRARPVVVYCWDALCDMSPRAAAWLEQLGFDGYDYAAGKVDWLAHGLPTEGDLASTPTAGSFARDDVAVCGLDEEAAQITQRIQASPYGFALVVADGVVLGRVRGSRVDGAPGDATAKLLMEPGPSTTRPHIEPKELARRLRSAEATVAILTSPDGVLIGVVRGEDLPA